MLIHCHGSHGCPNVLVPVQAVLAQLESAARFKFQHRFRVGSESSNQLSYRQSRVHLNTHQQTSTAGLHCRSARTNCCAQSIKKMNSVEVLAGIVSRPWSRAWYPDDLLNQEYQGTTIKKGNSRILCKAGLNMLLNRTYDSIPEHGRQPVRE